MNEYLEQFLAVGSVSYHDAEAYADSYRLRRELCKKFAWAIPTPEALQRIADLGPVVEIGAGTGYWAYLLRGLGVEVAAYDIAPPGHCLNGWHPDATQWTEVVKGGPERAYWHRDSTLFLCWPPYDDSMAYDSLKVYRGSTVVYVGELDGCTGDDSFHELLESRWNIESFTIPQWDGLHDAMHICTRKVGG